MIWYNTALFEMNSIMSYLISVNAGLWLQSEYFVVSFEKEDTSKFHNYQFLAPSLIILAPGKSRLTILKKSCRQKHNRRNISRRNVIQNVTNNSPSNNL